MKDAVDLFLEISGFKNNDDWIRKGIDTIIIPDSKNVIDNFRILTDEIENKNKIYIRAYGRGNTSGKREEYERFLKYVLNNNSATISIDKTNNASPTKRFNEFSGFNRKQFKNYRLSHVWDGMSKNPYAFCALWNMSLTPYFIDPLTGHETKHDFTKAFSSALRKHIYKIHKESIKLYNDKMKQLEPRIDEFINDPNNFQNFQNKEKMKIKENFKVIEPK